MRITGEAGSIGKWPSLLGWHGMAQRDNGSCKVAWYEAHREIENEGVNYEGI